MKKLFEIVRDANLAIGMISLIVMTIVSAIILFSNSAQIHTIANFDQWRTWWILFLIASIILTGISILVIIKSGRDKASIPATIGDLLSVVCLVVVLINTPKLKNNFNPADFIDITLTSKDDNYYGSTTTLYFEVTNNSDYTMTYFNGKANYYNMDSLINQGSMNCSGNFGPHSTSTMYVQYSSENIKSTLFANLGATFQLTDMEFGDDGVFKVKGKTFEMKELVPYNEDPAYNTGNQLLNDIRKRAGKDAIIPDNYIKHGEYDGNVKYFSYSDYSEHRGCFVKFWFDTADAYNCVESFCNKLVNNGFNQYYKQEYERPYDYSEWECEYRKNGLIIEVDGVYEGDRELNSSYDAYIITNYFIKVYYLVA